MTGSFLAHAQAAAPVRVPRVVDPWERAPQSRSDDWAYRVSIPKALRRLGRSKALRVMRGEAA